MSLILQKQKVKRLKNVLTEKYVELNITNLIIRNKVTMVKGKPWRDEKEMAQAPYKKKLKHKKLEPYNRKEGKYGKVSS